MKRRLLSTLIILCMILTLLPGVTLAAENDSWVGGVSFDHTANASGTGWTWDSASSTLTLSGVEVSNIEGRDTISIKSDAAIVLEGTNSVNYTGADTGQSAVHCGGNLTIRGSGTLNVSSKWFGISSSQSLTINSGFITTKGAKNGLCSSSAMTVNGGYINASGIAGIGFTQSGGYVYASGDDCGLNCVESVTISGGYLEASGATAIHAGTITNSGGVIKATAKGAMKYGIEGAANFTGGVTIASTTGETGKAINGSISGVGTGDTDEGLFVDGAGSKTNPTSSEEKFVVIAKTAQSTTYTGATADGVYVKASSVGWQPSAAGGASATVAATVTGGCYIKCNRTFKPSGNSNAVSVTNKCAINGTLVAIGKDAQNCSAVNTGSGSELTVNGALVAQCPTGMAISEFGTANIRGSLISDGNASFKALTVEPSSYTGVNGDVTLKGANTINGYMTANSASGTGITVNSAEEGSLAVSATGAVTAVGAPAYYGPEITLTNKPNADIAGSGESVSPPTLKPAQYVAAQDANSGHYEVDNSECSTVFIAKAFAPDYTLYYNSSDGSLHRGNIGGKVYDGTYSGSGSSLTLNGFNFSTTASTALVVPGGTTIALAEGSTNTIESTSSTSADTCGIEAQGALTINGKGSLAVTLGDYSETLTDSGNAKNAGLHVSGDLTVKDAANISIKAGNISFNADPRAAVTINSYGVLCYGGNVTLEDSARLTVESGNGTITPDSDTMSEPSSVNCFGIQVAASGGQGGKLTIKDTASLTATAGSASGGCNSNAYKDTSTGIELDGVLSMTGGTINATGGSAYKTTGMSFEMNAVNPAADLTGGTINAVAGSGPETRGLRIGRAVVASVTVTGGSITAKGGTGATSHGIYSDTATFDGCFLTAQGNTQALGYDKNVAGSAPTFKNLTVKGSGAYAGTGPVTYAPTNIDNYKWVNTAKQSAIISYTPTPKPPVVLPSEGGEIAFSPANPQKGDVVTVTLTPKAGMEPAELTVKDSAGSKIPVTKNSNGTYSFIQPESQVTLAATFKEAISFIDVSQSDWFYEDVLYVVAKGLFKGKTETEFAPLEPMTRAMLATVLYRLEGEPTVMFVRAPDKAFSDVPDGAWYEKAVQWAQLNGIVEGSDGKFMPDVQITREQLATMLYRYEQYKGGGFTGSWMFPLDYKDAASVSDWAYEPLCWMTMNKLMQGDGDNLMPKAASTRSQVAALLHRFAELVAE